MLKRVTKQRKVLHWVLITTIRRVNEMGKKGGGVLLLNNSYLLIIREIPQFTNLVVTIFKRDENG